MIIMLLYPGVRCYVPYYDFYTKQYEYAPLVDDCSQCKPTRNLTDIKDWCSWQCAPFPDTSTASCVLPGAQRLIFDLYEEFQTCRSKWSLIVEVYFHL